MRWLRGLVFFIGSSPAVVLAWLFYQGELGVFPEETLLHWTGRIGLLLLLLTLAWGFARRFTGWVGFIATRRQLGLWAFWWLSAHLIIWLGWDQGWQWAWIADEISQLLHLQLGLVAWLITLALALTSPHNIKKAMPAWLWTSLHRLIYLATGLGLWHLWIATRVDYRLVTWLLVLFLSLVILRLIFFKPPQKH